MMLYFLEGTWECGQLSLKHIIAWWKDDWMTQHIGVLLEKMKGEMDVG